MPRVIIQWSHEELVALQTGVVVEMYGKVKSGRGKRLYLAEFDEKERKEISRLHKVFYGWYMRHGVPDQAKFTLETHQFIVRVCNFFGSL